MSQNEASAASADDSIAIEPSVPVPATTLPLTTAGAGAGAGAAGVGGIGGVGAITVYAKTSRVEHLTHLLRNLDGLIFIEFGLAYYHDNLSFLLAFRALTQVLYVQPKPSGHIAQGGLVPTLVVSLLCVITHLLHDPPSSAATVTSSRYAREWIHGGLLIDFVGEQGPTSRWVLLGYDLVILLLQLVMLMVGLARKQAIERKNTTSSSNSNSNNRTDAQTSRQDLASEEAGRRRSREGNEAGSSSRHKIDARAGSRAGAGAGADIEMDEFQADGSGSRQHDHNDDSPPPPSATPIPNANANPYDDGGPDLAAIMHPLDSLKQLARRPPALSQPLPSAAASRNASGLMIDENEERAARVRALLLGRLIAERLAVSR